MQIPAEKLNALKNFDRLPHAEIGRFAAVLAESSDWDLLRINPIEFAQTHGFAEETALDLCLHAARTGIFDFSYNLICPRCGGVAHAHHELDQVESSEFYCAVCTASSEVNLDDQVEVAFSPNPAVHRIRIDPLADIAAYNRYHFSRNYVISEELRALRKKLLRALVVLKPEATRRIRLKSGSHHVFQLISIETNTSLLIRLGVPGGQPGQSGSVLFAAAGFPQKEMAFAAAEIEFAVVNNAKTDIGFMVATPDLEKIMAVVARHPTQVKPFLTAKMLLNNQTFRDLYKIQNLSRNLNLNIKSLTIMFTDLRGSTEMYDRAGDVFAYGLVQEHFQLLSEAVRKYHGAIIKTMGDAIMATFSHPMDGIQASLDMMAAMAKLNDRVRGEGFEIGLKIGLHEGPALAVMRDERLDYFGQTVNIAARVQGLAAAGEIWITRSLIGASDSAGLNREEHEASLKGVGERTTVYKIFAAAS